MNTLNVCGWCSAVRFRSKSSVQKFGELPVLLLPLKPPPALHVSGCLQRLYHHSQRYCQQHHFCVCYYFYQSSEQPQHLRFLSLAQVVVTSAEFALQQDLRALQQLGSLWVQRTMRRGAPGWGAAGFRDETRGLALRLHSSRAA